MDDLDIEIKFVKKWSTDEIINLYKSGDWWKDHFDKSGVPLLIKDSFIFAVVVDKNTKKAIGMGRILSDGISDAYIQDLIILPDFRKLGIGKMLVNKLVNYCISKKIYWIGLISEPDQDFFYEKIGFERMKNYIPMKYKIEDK